MEKSNSLRTVKMKFIIGFLSFFGMLDNIQGQNSYLDSTYLWTERHTGFWGLGPVTAYKLSSSPLEFNGNIYYEVLHLSLIHI